MINNEWSLSRVIKTPSYAQADQFSMRQDFYVRVKSRFLQQSAQYLGSSLSSREIEAFLEQENFIRS